jgi:hypothetical protein
LAKFAAKMKKISIVNMLALVTLGDVAHIGLVLFVLHQNSSHGNYTHSEGAVPSFVIAGNVTQAGLVLFVLHHQS